MDQNNLKKEALFYHAKGRPGKIEVIPTKETANQRDLSLAYSPGVAEPCLAINANPDEAYRYTAKGNLVAVISNGTAVLGLGDIGPEAGKPVMEGKGLLFKIYADIDCFDLELDTKDVDEFVRTVKILEPTFGGVNLEDISAPACFEIEERLKQELNIPVMHDDQHGTAIISAAALLNALDLVDKDIAKVRIVVNGAGASAISCTRLYVALGARKENIFLYDSKGLIHPDRDNLDGKKPEFVNGSVAASTTLTEILEGADVFIGLSRGDVLSKDMVKGMARDCVIFAMANPDPEIRYEDAKEARPDCIMATGRSDYPNQVNNVLGFPFIFRGALDVRASEINEEMKLAAVYALAELAKKPVPDIVNLAYGDIDLKFGKEYIIPKPVDPRLITEVAPAVAKAAMETGVARINIDLEEYMNQLAGRQGKGVQIMRNLEHKAQQNPKRVVFAEGEHTKIIRAAHAVASQGIATPILLGNEERIIAQVAELGLDFTPTIFNPARADERLAYAEAFYQRRQRSGMTRTRAREIMRQANYFGPMMVSQNDADAFVSGLTYNYPEVLRPAMEVVGAQKDRWVSGLYAMLVNDKIYIFTDATVIIDPTAEQLAAIALNAADFAKLFDIEPRIAMLSFSNFGSVHHPAAKKVADATRLVKAQRPDLQVDGEMQADVAVMPELMQRHYPFSQVKDANVLVFPELSSANTAYKLLSRLGGAEAIGPILVGMNKPIHVLETGADVRDIVNVAIMSVVDAQNHD
ncbi:MAG: NADP-dependent malic enzyme [Caldilineaceae bacterium]|nr:NADP-dependent malic enzyme [Caldilineaceae bacterium]